MLRAWLDLPANSTKEKEGKEGREGERGGGTKGTVVDAYVVFLASTIGPQDLTDRERVQKIELSTRQSYIEGEGGRRRRRRMGKKERQRPDFYTLAMHHEYEWLRSEVRKAGIHIPGHIRHSSADPSCRLLTLSGRGNRQNTWGYRIYIQRPSVFTPPT